jgi:hypothetical protein
MRKMNSGAMMNAVGGMMLVTLKVQFRLFDENEDISGPKNSGGLQCTIHLGLSYGVRYDNLDDSRLAL